MSEQKTTPSHLVLEKRAGWVLRPEPSRPPPPAALSVKSLAGSRQRPVGVSHSTLMVSQ